MIINKENNLNSILSNDLKISTHEISKMITILDLKTLDILLVGMDLAKDLTSSTVPMLLGILDIIIFLLVIKVYIYFLKILSGYFNNLLWRLLIQLVF